MTWPERVNRSGLPETIRSVVLARFTRLPMEAEPPLTLICAVPLP